MYDTHATFPFALPTICLALGLTKPHQRCFLDTQEHLPLQLFVLLLGRESMSNLPKSDTRASNRLFLLLWFVEAFFSPFSLDTVCNPLDSDTAFGMLQEDPFFLSPKPHLPGLLIPHHQLFPISAHISSSPSFPHPFPAFPLYLYPSLMLDSLAQA